MSQDGTASAAASDTRCRRCGETITAAVRRVRVSLGCPVCDWHPIGGSKKPLVLEHRQSARGHVYLIAGDGGWWIVTLPDGDEMLAIDGRAEGERFGAGQYQEAKGRARDIADELAEPGDW